MQKIKEEAKRAKASELEHSKKVSNLEKETRSNFFKTFIVTLKASSLNAFWRTLSLYDCQCFFKALSVWCSSLFFQQARLVSSSCNKCTTVSL